MKINDLNEIINVLQLEKIEMESAIKKTKAFGYTLRNDTKGFNITIQ